MSSGKLAGTQRLWLLGPAPSRRRESGLGFAEGEPKAFFWPLLVVHWPLYGMLFLTGTGIYILSPFIPAIAHGLGQSVGAIASVVTYYAVAYAVSAPLLGLASDRIGNLPLVALGGALMLAGNLWFAGALSLHELQWARAAMGVGGAMAGPAIWAHIAERTAPSRHGRAIGLGMAAFALGQIVGIPAVSLAAVGGGWQWVFGIVGMLFLPLVLAIALRAAAARRLPQQPAAAPTGAGPRWHPQWPSLEILGTLGVTFLFHAANLAGYTFLGALFVQHYGAAANRAAAMGIVIGLGGLLGSFVAGKSIDALKARARTPMLLLTGWCLMLAVAVWGATAPLSIALSLAALGFWFVASTAFTTTQLAVLTQAAPAQRASAVSWNQSLMYLGGGLGVWVMRNGISGGFSVGTLGLAFALCAAAGTLLLAAKQRWRPSKAVAETPGSP